MKYGRRARLHDARVPKYEHLKKNEIVLPSSIDHTKGMPDFLGMMGNDELGDCTAAAVGHALQVWSYNVFGKMFSPSDEQILKLYEATSGYNPSDPNTDNGAVEQTVLQFWLNNDVDSNRLAAFVEVNPSNMYDIKQSIYEAGLLYIGFNVPDFLQNLEDAGSIWDAQSTDNDIIGGHAVILTGYDTQGNLELISWGMRYKMTASFFATYVDEAYVLADAAWISASSRTPAGLTLPELEALMSSMRSAPASTPGSWHRHHRRKMKRLRKEI